MVESKISETTEETSSLVHSFVAPDPKTLPAFFQELRSSLLLGDNEFLTTAVSPSSLATSKWLTYQNEHGDGILHIAVRNKRWKSVEWLLQQGADALIPNKHGHTPLWLARKFPLKSLPPALVQSLQDPTVEPRPVKEKIKIVVADVLPLTADPLVDQMILSIQEGNDDLFSKLMIQSEDLNRVGSQQQTPLGFLIHQKDWERCARLLDYGATLSTKDINGPLWKQLESFQDDFDSESGDYRLVFEPWLAEAKTEKLPTGEPHLSVRKKGKSLSMDLQPSSKKPKVKRNQTGHGSHPKNSANQMFPSRMSLKTLKEPKEAYEGMCEPKTKENRPIVIIRKTRKCQF